jgi:putative phosphoribosyl transferase
LELPLDTLLIKRLLVTGDPLETKCAVDVGGTLFIDEEIEVPEFPISGAEHCVADGLSELTRRKEICRGSLPPVDFSGVNVLLVDNGIRTGSTILAAIRALKSVAASRITVAVPFTDLSAGSLVESHADRLISLARHEKLGHVGLGYKALVGPSDQEINKLILDTVT